MQNKQNGLNSISPNQKSINIIKRMLLPVITFCLLFTTACTDEEINNSINGDNFVTQKPMIADAANEAGFYLVGGDGSVYENTKITISGTNNLAGDGSSSTSQQRHTSGTKGKADYKVWCEDAGTGCTGTIVVTGEKEPPIAVHRIFAQLDTAIAKDSVDVFFEEENKDNYELIFDLSERDLSNLRNRVITLGKDVKSENQFAYYILYRDDPEKIYE